MTCSGKGSKAGPQGALGAEADAQHLCTKQPPSSAVAAAAAGAGEKQQTAMLCTKSANISL
jgi:hypothetical protein